MTLSNLWKRLYVERATKRRTISYRTQRLNLASRQPIEWEYNGKLHIFAMTFPNDWSVWCCVGPGEAYNQHFPKRGWPAQEATIAPFRTSMITCQACLFMWKLGAANFLWDPT